MKKLRFLTGTLILYYVSVLCISVHAQLLSDSLLIENKYRSFLYHQPKVAEQSSLIFLLHGSGGNGQRMVSPTAALAKTVEKENVILVYPNGYKGYWNECRKAANSLANQEDINEEQFFTAMIDFFKKRYAINDKQVFAIGSSGGGHMCYKLAMTMPEKIRAITVLIANMPDDQNMDCTEAKVALPVMIVNGTADPTNPYGGGMMQSGSFIMGTVRSTDQSFEYWASLAGYSGSPAKEKIADNDPSDGKVIERFTYRQPGKPEVVLLKVIEGKHDEPNDINVYVEAWKFFKRQL